MTLIFSEGARHPIMAMTLLSKSLSQAGQAITESFRKDDGRALEYFVGIVKQLRKDRPFITDSNERSVAYLLEIFSRSVHNNLFLDTPYSEVLEKERQQLLVTMGEYFTLMGKALEDRNKASLQDCIDFVVNEFLDVVEKLNQNFESTKALKWEKRKEES